VLSWLLGWVWWLLLPVRRSLACDSFRRCLPDLQPGPHLRRSVGTLVAQYIGLLLGTRCTIEGLEHARGGGLCLAGHFAAWEIMAASLAREIPVTAFIREPSSPLAARLITWLRGRGTDLELLTASDSPRRAYDALEAGRLVLLLQDQRHNDGIMTTFFGRPCRTSPAFGAMAWMARPKLLTIHQWRDGRRHRARIEPLDLPIPDGRRAATVALTQASQDFYEDIIRRHPDGWLWLHDRWKLPGKD
jgi:KDO2-lipid IV(A) lauroyltransferase